MLGRTATTHADESGAGARSPGHRTAHTDFLATPGNPSARSDKMWCAESDFEPRIRKIASYVTPQACSDSDFGRRGYGAMVVAVTSSSQGQT